MMTMMIIISMYIKTITRAVKTYSRTNAHC